MFVWHPKEQLHATYATAVSWKIGVCAAEVVATVLLNGKQVSQAIGRNQIAAETLAADAALKALHSQQNGSTRLSLDSLAEEHCVEQPL